MKRKNKSKLSLIGLIIILVLGPLAYFRFIKPRLTSAAWFNDGWHYRKSVQISNSSGSNLTDFQVSIGVGTSVLISQGKMKSDCSDIRITDTNGKLLPHWLEENNPGCNAATDTKVWVKAPSIPSSGGTVYIYYGNPSATNVGNGNKVFEFFDDFNGSSIDSSKWSQGTIAATSGTSFSISGGNLTGGNTNRYIQTTTAFTGDYIVETRVYETTKVINGFSTVGFYVSSSNSIGILTHDTSSYTRNDSGWTNFAYDGTSQWSRDIVKVVGTAASNATVSRTGETSGSYSGTYSNSGISSEYVRLSARYDNLALDQNYSATWDWIFVRKAVTTSPTSSLSSTEEISKAPVAYWSFDSGYGTVAQDESSNRNNGTLGAGNSAPSWQTEDMCVSGKCLKFDGSNDYVNMGNPTALKINSFTISLWYKQTGSPVSYPNLVGHGTGGWSFGINNEAGNVGKVFLSQSGQAPYLNSITVPATGTWYHLAVTDDGTTTKIYVNGKLENSTTSTPTFTFANGVRIGQDSTGGGVINGFIDEPKIYPYARSAAEIKADYNARGTLKGVAAGLGGPSAGSGQLANGLVGYWNFDIGSGTTVPDLSGNSLTGTLGTGTSAPAWSTGMYGTGLSFDSAGDTVTVSGTASSVKTVSFWTKPAATTNYFIDLDGTNSISASGGTLSATNFTSPAIYVNGSVSSTIASGSWQQVVVTTNTGITANAIKIGKIAANHLNGLIDEARIYNRVLTPSEVEGLYNWAPGPVAYYNFNEGVGSSAYDSSGYGNNGGLGAGNSAPTWATGKYGKGLKFDGGDYVGGFSESNFDFNGNFTIQAWLNPTSTNANYTKGAVCKETGASADGFCLGQYNGVWSWWVSGTALTSSNFSLNKLQHIAGIYNSGTLSLFINGINIGTTATVSLVNNNDELTIGRWIREANNNRYWNGSIDDVKIYNYARTQKQIVEDMNAGHPAVGSPIGSAVAHYKFDEGYGTTANNSGNGGATLNGTISGASWNNDGKFGKTLNFDGTDDVVTVTNSTAIDLNNNLASGFSFSGWFNADSVGEGSSGQMFWKGSGTYLRVSGQSGTNLNINASVDLTTDATKSLTAPITTNAWNHIVMAWTDDSDDELTLWVNGKNMGSSTNGDGAPAAEANNLLIGGTTTANFDGKIDDFKVYSYELTEDEVKVDYNRGSALQLGTKSSGTGNTAASNAASQVYCIPGDSTTCSPPVAEWLMDEGIGSSAFDTSGNGNIGAFGASTAAPSWTTGKVGKGLKFDGSNDLASASDSNTLDITGDLTISAWIKPNSVSYDGDAVILSKWQAINASYFFGLDDDEIDFRISSDGISYGNLQRTTDLNISINKWYHVTGVYQSATQTIKLYINGSLSPSSTTGTIPSSIYNSAASLRLGGWTTGYYFSGLIDQVRIYNYARTPAQIAWDYNKGAPVGHWKLDECEGATAHGLQQTANSSLDGTITIGPSGSQTSQGTCALGVGQSAAWGNGATGKYNASLNFDGTDDYVSVGTGSSVNSVSFWAKPTSNTAGMLQLATGIGVTASSGVITAPGFTSPTIYVNGTTSTTLSAGSWQMVTVTSATAVNPSAVRFGLFGSTYYSGQMDDIKIWNYALTAAQIKLLYNASSGVRFGE